MARHVLDTRELDLTVRRKDLLGTRTASAVQDGLNALPGFRSSAGEFVATKKKNVTLRDGQSPVTRILNLSIFLPTSIILCFHSLASSFGEICWEFLLKHYP
jgi:hypothetical protein